MGPLFDMHIKGQFGYSELFVLAQTGADTSMAQSQT